MAAPADALAASEREHRPPVAGDDLAVAPHRSRPAACGPVRAQPRVRLELGLERRQQGLCLVGHVGDDDGEVLPPRDETPQREDERHDGGLPLAPRRLGRGPGAPVAVDLRRERVVEPGVGARLALDGAVVREVGRGEEAEIVLGAGAADRGRGLVGVEPLHRRLDLGAQARCVLGELAGEVAAADSAERDALHRLSPTRPRASRRRARARRAAPGRPRDGARAGSARAAPASPARWTGARDADPPHPRP